MNIYVQGITGRRVTIGTRVQVCEKWYFAHIPECHIVSKADDIMLDWDTFPIALQRKLRQDLKEVSSYILKILQKIGIVSILLEHPITFVKEVYLWTLKAHIFPEKNPSISLLKKHIFCQNDTTEKITLMTICTTAVIWWDIVLFEQRSKRVGD